MQRTAASYKSETLVAIFNKLASSRTNFVINLNGFPVNALIDTIATNSHVNDAVAKRSHLKATQSINNIGLAIEGSYIKRLPLLIFYET